MHPIHFDYWAVLVSALILWFLGAIWYSPVLFAKPWMALVGVKSDKGQSMVGGMIASLIGDVLMSFVLDHIVLWSGADTFALGALIGLIAWLGFFAAPNYPQSLYEGRPFKLFAINNGYMLVGLVIVGGLLAVWK